MPKWKKDETIFPLKVIVNDRNIRINLPRQLWEEDLDSAESIIIEKHKNGKISIRKQD